MEFIQRGVLHIALETFENWILPQQAKNHSEIDEEPIFLNSRYA
jgi:hypothetical protein